MAETTPSASTHGPDTAQRPHLTESAIDHLGLTLLATGGSNPSLDVIFVHGLQGHPKDTWTYVRKVKQGASKKDGSRSRLKFWKNKAEEAGYSNEDKLALVEDDDETYWPTKLLAPDLPTARIFTYGYDSRVSHFFNGPASQNTITDNGRALLSSIASQRQDCLGRPMLLIVHSLGGIVVKSALRISAIANDNDADLKDIYQSTFAILFFGTPHRGSDWTDAGLIARNFAAVLGFSTTDYNLRALRGNTEILEILRDDFARMLAKEAFYITSFQESMGYKGVKGLDTKIVGPDSSGIDHDLERKMPINANHLDMCKFAARGSTRKDYDEKVRAEVIRHWQRESKRLQEQQKMIVWNDDCHELLKSLESADTGRRFDQVEKAYRQTFDWLFAKPELGFESWLESGKGLYWCRGYPASGKSTLMKWLYNDPRTTEALAIEEGRKAKVNFFFHDRGSEIQKSFKGLLQGIVYQILQESPELLPLIVPIRQKILRRLTGHAYWTEEDIYSAFQELLRQQKYSLDITLFLDALDEYHGAHESIADFLYSITSVKDTALTNIKVCFSSRPLQIFLDKFTKEPGFDIQEHTTEDIKLVIRSKMSQNPRMSQCMQAVTQGDRVLAEEFAVEVSSRAKGIFLWVKLVLDELLDDFTAGETLQGLIKKLVFLPPKLEDFYQHTLDRLPGRYHNDTKVIFEVLRCAIAPLGIHDLFEICRYTKVERLAECTSCIAANHEWNNDSVQRWTRSRTGGLVQLVLAAEDEYNLEIDFICPAPYRRGEPIYVVQFLHQTVKTFSQSALWATTCLTENRFPCHDGNAYIARYILALLFHHRQSDSNIERRFGRSDDEESSVNKQYFWGKMGAFHVIDPLIRHMSLSESKTPKVLLPSLMELGDDGVSDVFNNGMWTGEMQYPPLDCISALAVWFHHCYILDELLERKKGKAYTSSPPLLHLAVMERPLYPVAFSEDRLRSIRSLLDHGAYMSEVFEGYTPYGTLCKLIMESKHYRGYERDDDLQNLILLFLRKGQAPNIRIEFRRRLTKRTYRSAQQCLVHFAAEYAKPELISTLLDYGADVNVVDDAGSTPLDCVCDGPREIYRVQLSEIINNFLQDPPGSRPTEDLRRGIRVASLLISRGGRFGVSSADVDHKFSKERQPVTQAQVEGLKSRGIDIDNRIMWRPPGILKKSFYLLKSHVVD